ncbi:DUF2931 family protein [Hymenobacter sp.]|uniref:DUF2931 family protein n=1 Tax=Hymenobacter sp. TaxID=1898978 RepID=UPI00286A9149|nr:DUF2931 family protein [Hymenobacter sp.]
MPLPFRRLFRPSLIGSLATGLCLLTFSTCRPVEPYQTEQFALTAGPAAAEGYPMEVVEGRFLTSDGKSFVVSPSFLEGDWGSSSTTYVSGDGMSPAPDSLEVRWFSYPEDKFYEGHFLLPQRRIYDLLKQGFWNTFEKKHDTYNELTVCLLPKGVVVVWLSGRNQVLIGRYEGREIDFDFKRFNSAANRPRMIQQERAKLPPAVQEQIRTGALNTRQWDAYLKTYPWQVAFSRPLKLYDYGLRGVDAQVDNHPLAPEAAPARAQALLHPALRPAPSNLLLLVDAGYGRRRQIQVRAFDEAETLAAFQSLHAANPALPLTLYVETDERVEKARLFLKNDRQQVELVKSPVLLFDAE